MTTAAQLACICGHVQLEALGKPIVNVACCCDSCRAAGVMGFKAPKVAVNGVLHA